MWISGVVGWGGLVVGEGGEGGGGGADMVEEMGRGKGRGECGGVWRGGLVWD